MYNHFLVSSRPRLCIVALVSPSLEAPAWVFIIIGILLIGQVIINWILRPEAHRHRRHAICPKDRRPSTSTPKERRQALLALVLQCHQLLRPLLSNQQLRARLRSAPHSQQAYGVPLRDCAQLRIRPPDISLPVWVVCDIAGRYCDGVVVDKWIDAAGGRVAVGFSGNAVAAGGLDGEDSPERFPDADGLCSVFLDMLVL